MNDVDGSYKERDETAPVMFWWQILVAEVLMRGIENEKRIISVWQIRLPALQ
jgi:hypothetical protein